MKQDFLIFVSFTSDAKLDKGCFCLMFFIKSLTILIYR